MSLNVQCRKIRWVQKTCNVGRELTTHANNLLELIGPSKVPHVYCCTIVVAIWALLVSATEAKYNLVARSLRATSIQKIRFHIRSK